MKENGKFLILYMGWFPSEDNLIKKSQELVLKYNPSWTGANEERKDVYIPKLYFYNFDIAKKDLFDVSINFNRESWHGRVKSCRGVGASMNEQTIKEWEK